MGLGSATVGRTSRIFVVDLDGVIVGFLVDAATEVMKLAGESIEPAPEELKGAIHDNYLEGVGKLDDRLVIILNLRNLLSDDEMEAVDAAPTESVGAASTSVVT